MCTWEDLGLSMVLTGPVPITNARREFSFKLFLKSSRTPLFWWPSGCSFSTRTSFRPVSPVCVPFKASKSSSLPVCPPFVRCFGRWVSSVRPITVTMTVIIVGPILLALGVSYGLHITNRYAEEEGTKGEKMQASLTSTGRAVFLSAGPRSSASFRWCLRRWLRFKPWALRFQRALSSCTSSRCSWSPT